MSNLILNLKNILPPALFGEFKIGKTKMIININILLEIIFFHPYRSHNIIEVYFTFEFK